MEIRDKLLRGEHLTEFELQTLIEVKDPVFRRQICDRAGERARSVFGRSIYTRGLVEFTNYCCRNCLYCGIRADNGRALRYRLTREQILSACEEGYALGFRTFVLQGGEDPFFTDARMEEIVRRIKSAWPDCAVTLSLGERSPESYRRLREAGADRYLLRHETADASHFSMLHPNGQRLESRMACLRELKALGYQVGTGFMVGSPGQESRHLAKDLAFVQDLRPEMVGIGPFIPHCETPFAGRPAGSLEDTVYLIGLLRLMLPYALIPSTTALNTIAPDGRERGILAGANVVMPNLSPREVREKYSLYDHKLTAQAESAQNREELERRMAAIGYTLVVDRGDFRAPGKE